MRLANVAARNSKEYRPVSAGVFFVPENADRMLPHNLILHLFSISVFAVKKTSLAGRAVLAHEPKLDFALENALKNGPKRIKRLAKIILSGRGDDSLTTVLTGKTKLLLLVSETTIPASIVELPKRK
jgi:hypothetical protein